MRAATQGSPPRSLRAVAVCSKPTCLHHGTRIANGPGYAGVGFEILGNPAPFMNPPASVETLVYLKDHA